MNRDLLSLLSDYDFTDSIITNIKFENNLIDIYINIDYYWDIQEGKTESRELVLKLISCLDIKMNNSNAKIKALEEGQDRWSYFTILKVEGFQDEDGIQTVKFYFSDYKNPSIEVVCRSVFLKD